MGGPVKTTLAGLYPGIDHTVIKASALSKTKSYTVHHDFEQDAQIVTCMDFDGNKVTQAFTKEFLEDCPAEKFLEILADMLEKPVVKPMLSVDIEANKPFADLTFDQKKIAKLAAMYGASAEKIASLLNVPANFDYETQQKVKAAALAEASEIKKLHEDYIKTEAKKAAAVKQLEDNVAKTKAKLNFDGKLHVYDLGDGMLVPCEMVHDLAHMFMDKPNMKAEAMPITQAMIDDSAYDAPAKASVAALQQKLDDMIEAQIEKDIANAHKLYPGKIIMLDDLNMQLDHSIEELKANFDTFVTEVTKFHNTQAKTAPPPQFVKTKLTFKEVQKILKEGPPSSYFIP